MFQQEGQTSYWNTRQLDRWKGLQRAAIWEVFFVRFLHDTSSALVLNKTVEKHKAPTQGVSNGLTEFKSARKIWPLLELLAKIKWVLACSCSQNFCYCSHARIFVKIPLWKNVLRNLTEKCTLYECFWKLIIHPRFADVLLKLVQVTILLERQPHWQR